MELIKNGSDIELAYGTTLFNDVIRLNNILKNDESYRKTVLGRVKLFEKADAGYTYYNYYLKIVSHLFIKTSWYDLFHLNVCETMNLDFSTFMYLKKLLDLYESKKAQFTNENSSYMKELEKRTKYLQKISKKEDK